MIFRERSKQIFWKRVSLQERRFQAIFFFFKFCPNFALTNNREVPSPGSTSGPLDPTSGFVIEIFCLKIHVAFSYTYRKMQWSNMWRCIGKQWRLKYFLASSYCVLGDSVVTRGVKASVQRWKSESVTCVERHVSVNAVESVDVSERIKVFPMWLKLKKKGGPHDPQNNSCSRLWFVHFVHILREIIKIV